MLKIRLTRRGKKNSPFFRMVVAEHTAPIKGKFIEVLGFVNPKTKEKSLKEDRIKYWIEKGAQCSDSAHNLLVKAGVVKGPKRAIKIKKKPVEPVSTEATAATAGKEEKKGEVALEKKEVAEPDKKEAEAEKPAAEPASNEVEEKKESTDVAEEKKSAEKNSEEKPEKTEG